MIPQNLKYLRILGKLKAFRKKEKRTNVIAGVLFSFSMGACIVISLLAIESVFWLTPAWKWLFILIFGLVFLLVLVTFPGRWLFSYLFLPHQPSDDILAKRIGQTFLEISDRLINAIQVFRFQKREEQRASPILAQSAMDQIYETVVGLDFDAAVSRQMLKFSLRLFVPAVIMAPCLLLLFHSSLLPAVHRWCYPSRIFEKPVPYALRFRPGTIRIIEGDSVLFSVESGGPMPSTMTLLRNEGGREAKKILLRRPFRHRMASIRNSFKYSYAFETYRSETYSVEVLKRPELKLLQVAVHPPSYTGTATRIYERNVGHIEALKASRVEVLIKSNKRNERASLVFQSGKRIGLAINGYEASGRFFIDRDDLYWIEIQDRLGILNDPPIRYGIRMLQDLIPTAKILAPESSTELDQSMSIPLVLEGNDDYGIKRARMGYCIESPSSDAESATDTANFELSLPTPPSANLLLSHLWKVESLNLFPEDVVHYYFEVEDNDALNGPKYGRSTIHSFRFPSIVEIIQKLETEQNHQIQTLDTIFAENQGLLKNMEQLSEELKTGQPIPWERKKDLLNKIENQKVDQEKLENLSERFDTMLEEIRKDDWVRMETLEKYEELRKRIQDLASPEINDMMKKMQDALKQADSEILKNAVEAFKITQEDVLKALDRMIALFKKLQAEQKVGEQLGRLSEMMERQKEINSSLNNDSIQDRLLASRQQQKLHRESEAFQEDAEKLSMTASGIPGFPSDLYRSFIEALKSEQLSDRLATLTESIQTGPPEDRVRQGEQAVQSMERLKKILENVRGQWSRQQKDRVGATLIKTSLQLLELSLQQETVMLDVKESRQTNSRVAVKQNAILSGIQQTADSLYRLTRETFSIPPGLGNAIGEAKDNIKKSMEQLEAGNRSGTALSQSKSMGALNRSVLEIQNALAKFKGGNSGLGMDGFSDQMEQMGQEQLALNKKLMQMLEQGGLSMESRAGMPRLGSEQQSLRQRLEQLLQKYQTHSELPGDLGGMAEDMEKVAQELLKQKADTGTIQRQEHILSRMLDSQRALKQQDEGSKQRKAKTGKEAEWKSPPRITKKKSADAERLQQRLFELSNEGFSVEYRGWIRKYYERLAKENK
jgi:hypothetical protein